MLYAFRLVYYQLYAEGFGLKKSQPGHHIGKEATRNKTHNITSRPHN
jgi:hypothetical protein